MTLNRSRKKRQIGSRLKCVACGRSLTNDQTQPNAAAWALAGARVPYCADSEACRRDAEGQ